MSDVPPNPWNAQTKRELRLRQIGCGVCVVGVPLLIGWLVVVVIFMDKT